MYFHTSVHFFLILNWQNYQLSINKGKLLATSGFGNKNFDDAKICIINDFPAPKIWRRYIKIDNEIPRI